MINPEFVFLTAATSCLCIVMWALLKQRSTGPGDPQAIQMPFGAAKRSDTGFEATTRKFFATLVQYSGVVCPEVQERACRAMAAMLVAAAIGQAHRHGTPALLAHGIVPSDYEPVIVSIVFMARSAAAAALIWLFLAWIRYIEHGGNSERTSKGPDHPGAAEVSKVVTPDTNQSSSASPEPKPDN